MKDTRRAAHLVGVVSKVDLAEHLAVEGEVIAVAVLAQHGPSGLQAAALDEQRMQEEESWQRQPGSTHPLQRQCNGGGSCSHKNETNEAFKMTLLCLSEQVLVQSEPALKPRMSMLPSVIYT